MNANSKLETPNSQLGIRNPQLIYLHGFNSSPASHKAQLLQQRLAAYGDGGFYAPQLSPEPKAAVAMIKNHVQAQAQRDITLVGSSLGGYYATYLAQTFGLRAVLLNPAVRPYNLLRDELGQQRNFHTGELYEFTESHLQALADLEVETLSHPERFLLVVETGDEVLDYRHAVEKYRGAEQIVIPGGDHGLQSFAQHLDKIVMFAGWAA